jgi:signal transduction histidine kinase
MNVAIVGALTGLPEHGSIRIRRNDVAGRARAVATAATAVAVAAVAVGVWQLVSPVHLNNPGARAGIETAITLTALLSAALMFGHFSHSRRRRDLLLLGAVIMVSLTDFAFSALPAVTGPETVAFGMGARLSCMVLVSIAFAAAALAPDRKLLGGGRRVVALTVVAGLGVAALSQLLDRIAGPGSSRALVASYAPISMVAGLGSTGLLAIAGVAFVRRAGLQDSHAGLLAAACFLLAGANLGYLMLANLRADWVTPGDGLRLAAYAVLLVVAVRQARETSHHAADAAINAERLRLARDLHDGLAQDLAVITTYAQRLEAVVGLEHPLTVAARSALAASRGAIVDLSASQAPTTAAALRRVGDELGARFGVEVRVKIEADSARVATHDLSRTDREHVVRIAREAIVNAIRHGGARRIDVTLDCRGQDFLLRVSDDGRGISQPEVPASGFGMAAMRARAESLGGQLIARQRVAGGTELDVRLASSPASD